MEISEKELKIFDDLGFLLEITTDGSFTLRLKEGTRKTIENGELLNLPGESMHHSAGAYSETAYIYGPLLLWTLKIHPEPRVLSIGLGLGYNEIYTAALAAKSQATRWQMDSFEIVDGLRNYLVECLSSEDIFSKSVYGRIALRLSESLGLKEHQIYDELSQALAEKRWQLLGDIRSHLFPVPYQAILQDAFSKKTNPDLWNEEFLEKLLKATSDSSGIASYASLGVLKRKLKAFDFHMLTRDGFHGKRNCTLATKGISPQQILQQVPDELKQLWKIS